jgi:hypothetical protein
LKTELNIRVNGKKISDMGLEFKFGQMVQSMRGIGRTTKLMVKAYSGMFMATNMKVTGKEIRHMGMANTPTATELLTKANGEMTCSTEKVLNSGTITQNMKVNIERERNTVPDVTLGKMDPNTPGNGMKTEFMDEASTLGMTIGNMKEIGRIIIWTAMVSTPGKMAESMKDPTKKIKNMVMVSIHGPTTENTTANGKTEDNMEKVLIYQRMDSSEKAFGKMEREIDGLMIIKNKIDKVTLWFNK